MKAVIFHDSTQYACRILYVEGDVHKYIEDFSSKFPDPNYPDGIKDYIIIDAKDIPKDRTNRNSWIIKGGKLEV